jgi:hypothetical protein
MAAFQVFMYGRFWVFTEEIFPCYLKTLDLRIERRAGAVSMLLRFFRFGILACEVGKYEGRHSWRLKLSSHRR